jgi:hypothetical protein
LVVQEALDTMLSLAASYLPSFTPITNMGASAAALHERYPLVMPLQKRFHDAACAGLLGRRALQRTGSMARPGLS